MPLAISRMRGRLIVGSYVELTLYSHRARRLYKMGEYPQILCPSDDPRRLHRELGQRPVAVQRDPRRGGADGLALLDASLPLAQLPGGLLPAGTCDECRRCDSQSSSIS